MSLTGSQRPISLRLAEFVAQTDYDDLSPGALHAARRSLVNFLGVTIAGAHHVEVETAVSSLLALGGRGEIPILGRNEGLDAMSAALVNGIGSAVLDFDSTQMKRTNIHPSGPVLPAILAIAQLRPVTGREFITAFVLGVEIACRLANGLFGEKNDGWHVTGITGGVGAAAAVSKLLKLEPPQIVAAMGIAANQSAGLREMYGTACKAMTPGRAARDGLVSGMLAARGFSAPERPIEGAKGLARVFAGIEAPDTLVADLGDSFEIELNIYKPYPCAIVTHAVIDGVARLCAQHDLAAASIASIELQVAPVAIELAGHMHPMTELQTKFSLSHAAAIAVLHRAARIEHFNEQNLNDPIIDDLRARVQARPRSGLRKNEAYIRIVTENGTVFERHVEHVLGSLKNPMSDNDISNKFLDLTTSTIGVTSANKLLEFATTLYDHDEAKLLSIMAMPNKLN